MRHLGFEYELEETLGWARAVLTLGESSFELIHGYCSHPLGTSASIAVVLAKGEGLPRTEAVFDEESHGYVASFTHRDPTRCELRRYHDVLGRAESAGELLVQCEIDSVHFAASVGTALHKLLTEHGMTGFLQKWDRYSFPFREYWILRLLLDRSALIDELLDGGAALIRPIELRVLASEPDWAAARLEHRTSRIDLPVDIRG